MLYRPFTIVIALLFFCFTAIAVRAEVLIDDFGDGPITLDRELGESRITAEQSGLSTDSVIGGSRAFSLRAGDRNSGATGGVTVEIDPETQSFNYTTDPGITAVNFAVTYGSLDEPLGADLTIGGADRLRFEFASAAFFGYNNKGYFDIGVRTVNDDHDFWGGGAYVGVPSSDSPFYVDVPFSELQAYQPYALDFSRVISFYFGSANGNIPGNFVLDRIVAVPEPNAVLLGCLGVLLLAWRRR